MAPPHVQDQVWRDSLENPGQFWTRQAEQLHWHRKPDKPLHTFTKTLKDGITHDHWSWFPGGEISTTYNCVDRHVLQGRGDVLAICWDSPVTGEKEQFSYKQLLGEVETLAGVLREEGVRKGDVVLIYSECGQFSGYAKPYLLMRIQCQ